MTTSQPLSSKHTLTRGDKIESKYECLARLINATKPNSEIPKIDSGTNFNTLVTTADKSDNLTTTNVETRKNAYEKQAEEVTKSSTSDNNNSNVDIKIAAVDDVTREAVDQAVCELKIVVKPEQISKETNKSDMDEDSSMATSNSTISLDLTDKNGGADANGKDNEDNNNRSATNQKCIEDQAVQSNSEQTTIETIAPQAQQHQQQQITRPDLTENVSDETSKSESESRSTSNDCNLDINENKSDMKLNYAEVVKVENTLESTLCENKNFNVDAENSGNDVDNKKIYDSTRNVSSDLDDKVQSPPKAQDAAADNVKRLIGCSSPKPIQICNVNRHDDEEMSPVCKVRLPLNSPRLTKSKDIMSELPLTPDSSHSLDSSCEYSTPFETIKPYSTSIVPERSFSSESLNSETSIESNDSKSSIKLAEAKFTKNGTLERQSSSTVFAPPSFSTPNGLQVLMLWNNHISRDSAQSISKLLSATTTLEILNVGKNVLSNDFVTNIKASLKANTSLTSFGLQSVHLSNDGVKTLSEILDFGGNTTLQRVDLRDNNLQVSGLSSLNEILKSNKSITRIDLDDVPRRACVSVSLIFFFV